VRTKKRYVIVQHQWRAAEFLEQQMHLASRPRSAFLTPRPLQHTCHRSKAHRLETRRPAGPLRRQAARPLPAREGRPHRGCATTWAVAVKGGCVVAGEGRHLDPQTAPAAGAWAADQGAPCAADPGGSTPAALQVQQRGSW
jgi:hypothetical protein